MSQAKGFDLCRAPLFRHPPAVNQIIANRSGWKLL
jgi:hypothetical protein